MATKKDVSFIDKAIAGLKKGSAANVRTTVKNIAKRAGAKAPVDKGALQASLYTVTDRGSTYEESVAQAKAKNSKVNVLPEARLPDASGVYVGIVGAAVEYADPVENGHYSTKSDRFVAGQPFVSPSTREEEADFQKRQEQVIKDAGFR